MNPSKSGEAAGVETAYQAENGPTAGATTGSAGLRFKYNAELSKLPREIAQGIQQAHGGFAKTPTGDLYFGLRGTGLIRLSADLKTKTLLATGEHYTSGGLHNCTYLDRDGGLLLIPDDEAGRLLVVDLQGNEVKTLTRPSFFPEGDFKPTDIDIAPNGKAYAADGYGDSKQVFTVDLDKLEYDEIKLGGPTGAGRTDGKFTTPHGVTFDPTNKTLLVTDRERQWVQRFDLDGNFLAGFDVGDCNPCEVDLVEYGGERLMVVGCLVGRIIGEDDKGDPVRDNGVVQILRDGQVVSTLDPKKDLGLDQFQHIHTAAGVVCDGTLHIICYGWAPGCYAVLEHVAA